MKNYLFFLMVTATSAFAQHTLTTPLPASVGMYVGTLKIYRPTFSNQTNSDPYMDFSASRVGYSVGIVAESRTFHKEYSKGLRAFGGVQYDYIHHNYVAVTDYYPSGTTDLSQGGLAYRFGLTTNNIQALGARLGVIVPILNTKSGTRIEAQLGGTCTYTVNNFNDPMPREETSPFPYPISDVWGGAPRQDGASLQLSSSLERGWEWMRLTQTKGLTYGVLAGFRVAGILQNRGTISLNVRQDITSSLSANYFYDWTLEYDNGIRTNGSRNANAAAYARVFELGATWVLFKGKP